MLAYLVPPSLFQYWKDPWKLKDMLYSLPDNNGHNDVLFVRSNGIIDITYFRIFDRWGKMLFESDEIESGWDGTFKGAAMPAGVYLYTLQASCGSNNPILKQGNVTLLR